MSKEFLLKVANVLEELAKSLDAKEAEKVASEKKEHEALVKSVVDKYAAFSGEELPEAVQAKLAASDVEVLSSITTLLEKKGAPSFTMGGASEKTASFIPRTKQEHVDAAWNAFGAFCGIN